MGRVSRGIISLVALTVGALAAAPAGAQWVRLQRCSGALPCALPFGIRHNPDPLLAGQFGHVSSTALSAGISLAPEPTIELEKSTPPSVDFAAEAARRFVLAHPAPAQPKSKPASAKTPTRP